MHVTRILIIHVGRFEIFVFSLYTPFQENYRYSYIPLYNCNLLNFPLNYTNGFTFKIVNNKTI